MANKDGSRRSDNASDLQLVFQPKPRHKHSFIESMGLTGVLSNLAVQTKGEFIHREHVDNALANDSGLRAILALNGVSMAFLIRVIQLARTGDDEDLRKLLRADEWTIPKYRTVSYVWSVDRIEEQVKEDAAFRAGIVNLFYEGASISSLHDNFPPSEVRKLSIQRMSFQPFSVIATLVDYGLYYEQARSVGEALEVLGRQLES